MPAAHPDRPKRTISTRYVRFPIADWPLICRGVKTEFRMPVSARWGPRMIVVPTPVVGYAMTRYASNADYRMFVVTEIRVEPLGAISDASLRAEGFETIKDFKHYWRQRHTSKGFRMLQKVNVLTVRPWQETDNADMGRLLLESLYGDHLA